MGGSLRYAYSRQSSSGSTRALNYNMTLASPYLRNASNTDWVRSEMTGKRVLQYGAYTSFFGVHPLSNRGDYWDNDNNDNFSNNDASNLNARYYAQISLPYNIKFKTTLNLDDNTSHTLMILRYGEVGNPNLGEILYVHQEVVLHALIFIQCLLQIQIFFLGIKALISIT